MTELIGTSKEARDALIVLAAGRLIIQAKTPFLLSSVYGLVPVATEETETSFLTPGLVFGYNPKFLATCTDEEAAFVMLHEVFHDRLRFFDILKVVGEQLTGIANKAQDIVINGVLKEMGYPVFSWAHLAEKHKFPEKLTTYEYIELLQKGGKKGCDHGQQCSAPKELEKELDAKFGRAEIEVRAIERATANAIKSHVARQRGSGAGLLEEWAKIAFDEPVRLNWRQIMDYMTMQLHGQISVGGDDYSLRRPSKRSFVRGIIRPGNIEQEVIPMFIFDTSASMNLEMLKIALAHTVGVLTQCGIQECYFMEVDYQVATPPTLVNLSYFLREDFAFKGRGGTSFLPAFDALNKMTDKPDIVWYWTDGDGQAPENPPFGVEVIWGLIPERWSRRPATWGHLVVISEDPTEQERIEQSLPY